MVDYCWKGDLEIFCASKRLSLTYFNSTSFPLQQLNNTISSHFCCMHVQVSLNWKKLWSTWDTLVCLCFPQIPIYTYIPLDADWIVSIVISHDRQNVYFIFQITKTRFLQVNRAHKNSDNCRRSLNDFFIKLSIHGKERTISFLSIIKEKAYNVCTNDQSLSQPFYILYFILVCMWSCL